MAVTIFAIGVTLLFLGSKEVDAYILAPSAIVTGLLYYPIRRFIYMWKFSVSFSMVPILVQYTSEKHAGMIILRLLKIFGKKL